MECHTWENTWKSWSIGSYYNSASQICIGFGDCFNKCVQKTYLFLNSFTMFQMKRPIIFKLFLNRSTHHVFGIPYMWHTFSLILNDKSGTKLHVKLKHLFTVGFNFFVIGL